MKANQHSMSSADWRRIESETIQKIRILEQIAKRMQPGPIADKICNDLILPCLKLLAEFCLSVEVDGTIEKVGSVDDMQFEMLEHERQKRIDAENDAVRQSLKVALLEQDFNVIRNIINKGGSAQDILRFLDTPPAE